MDIINRLCRSVEPSIRYKTHANILLTDPDSPKMLRLQQEVKSSERVQRLLSARGKDGTIPVHPYAKWYGAHWVLATLADIGYPAGDESLVPLREQVYAWLLSTKHKESTVRMSRGFDKLRPRIHASMEGNALFYLLRLGLDDERTVELADRLIGTQWPDGGWNCDRTRQPGAKKSSFHETLIPLRGLSLYAKVRKDSRARTAATRASEVFLKRRLYRAKHDSSIISLDFIRLHYPCYWHYDLLSGLKVLAESGFIRDERCDDALRLLGSKRLPDGGFPAEKKYYQVTKPRWSAWSPVDWGGISSRRTNEWVTVDALCALSSSP